MFVAVDSASGYHLLLLHDPPNAVNADLASLFLQHGGDFPGSVALMAVVEDSLHVFHGLVLVSHEPWRVPLLSVDDCAVLEAKGFAHEADAESSRLVIQYPFDFRNLGPMTGFCRAGDYREVVNDSLLSISVAFKSPEGRYVRLGETEPVRPRR